MVEMYWCKIFQTKYEVVVAVCDESLIDKEIKTKKLKIKVSKNFYGGRLVDGDTVVKLMEKATIGNLIGPEIIELAERNGFIAKENVILINGIPHAQFVKV
jgi:hypothetical protein